MGHLGRVNDNSVMLTPEQIEQHTLFFFDAQHQLDVHAETLAFTRRLLLDIRGMSPTRRDMIVLALSSRAIETGESVRLLCTQTAPLIDDATALARTLIEAVINAAFIARSDEAAADRYDAWGDYHAYVQEQKINNSIPARMPTQQRNEDYARFRERALKQFPDFGEKANKGHDWAKNLFSRVQHLDIWTESSDAALLYEEYRELSNAVHVNSLSIRSRVQEAEGHICIGKQYTEIDMVPALYATNDALLYLCAVLDEFYWGRRHEPEWLALLFRWRPYLNAAHSDELAPKDSLEGDHLSR